MRQSAGSHIARILVTMEGPSCHKRDQRWTHAAQFEPEMSQKQIIIYLSDWAYKPFQKMDILTKAAHAQFIYVQCCDPTVINYISGKLITTVEIVEY